MRKATSDPALIALSTTTYRLLLSCYPAGFRRQYGRHMVQVFRDCCLHAYRKHGRVGLLRLWAITLLDWFKTVIEEQLHRPTAMTAPKFIRLSGWAMVVSAFCMLFGFLSDAAAIRATLYRLVGLPASKAEYNLYRSFSENLGSFFVFIAILLLAFAVVGLRMRCADRVGGIGASGLRFSVLAGGAASAGVLGLPAGLSTWHLFIFGLAAQFGFLALFGMAVLRSRPLPRGNGLPLLAGIWIPLFLAASMIGEWLVGADRWLLPGWLESGMMLTMCASLAMLGYVLQRDAPLSAPG